MCFCSCPGIDKGVNKIPNNLITNKPTLEIEKPIRRAEFILLATLNIQKIYSARRRRDKPEHLVFFLNWSNHSIKKE